MLRGLYASASALLAASAWQETLGSDLANVDTPGYKAQGVEVSAFGQTLLERTAAGGPSQPVGAVVWGAAATAAVTDWQPGALNLTGRPLDVAPAPGQWLTVEQGGVRLITQDGALAVDRAGDLVTPSGARVLSAAGTPLRVPVGSPVAIAPDGTVTAGTVTVGRLGLVTVAAPAALTAIGDAMYRPGAGAGVAAVPAGQAAVTPGALWGSNVSSATALTDMVAAGNVFQANQEALITGTQAFGQFLGAVGK
jgi:flagellar basal-body rod protein FlgF